MKAHCPKCNTPMAQHTNHWSIRFECPRCDYRAEDEECDQPDKIERIILDNADRMNNKH